MKNVLSKKTNNLFKKHLLIIFLIFTMLWSITNQNIIFRITRPLIRDIESAIVLFQVKEYEQLETDNFIIRYQEIDENILKLVSSTAESKYQQTVDIFKYQPEDKITMIIYDKPEPMMTVTTLRKGTPPMGVYYGNTLHILDPVHWIKDTNRFNEIFYSEGPILHELVHLFTDHLGKGNFPIWFTEGVSLYFEYEVDGYQWGKGVEFIDDNYTLDNLTHSFYEKDQYLAYTKSFRLVKGFVEEEGIEVLIELIEELGKGKELEEYYHLFNN